LLLDSPPRVVSVRRCISFARYAENRNVRLNYHTSRASTEVCGSSTSAWGNSGCLRWTSPLRWHAYVSG
ncbi:hypothetical protein CLOM_g5523, partial [Closterium sp. NIES-68]